MNYPPVSNFCVHVDPRGRYFYASECPVCTPMKYRCVYCYQPAHKARWVRLKCMTGGDHVPAVDGFGARCSVCGLGVYEEKRGDPTTCKVSAHVLAVYPFRCEVCKGSVSLERPTICEDSYNAQHLISSGFVDMGLVRPGLAPMVSYAAEINGLLDELRRKKTTRRFVSKRR